MQTRALIDQLKVGVYIHLDLNWMDHPFGFGSFKIKSLDQIQTLREMGLKSVRIDLEKSDTRIEPWLGDSAAPASPAPESGAPAAALPQDPAIQAKRERQERLAQRREAIARVSRQYHKAAGTLRNLQAALQTRPGQSVEQAAALADELSASFFSEREVAIHALLSQSGSAEAHAHALNVALISLLVAREMQISQAEASLIAQGAFHHDIGLREVPSRILLKTDPLTSAERASRESHVIAGVQLGRELKLPDAVLGVIAQHHELADGSGYPGRLKGEAILPFARIVGLANYYDNLCNPVDTARALTPHETLSHLFAQQRARFDEKAIQILIRCLGVYPPGSLVQLSNETVCMVASVNTARPLRPTVVVYDAKTPRDAPMIVDLAHEADINIRGALRRSQVPPRALEYLTGRGRISYFFEPVQAEAPQP
jgi:putative nucleotidyltransferase with HDIG domain